MGSQSTPEEIDFNTLQFEKKLSSLKDSQDSINACCQWCLQNRTHHKKIVTAWLNVLKRVKVEQRLVLFYLANDVVQYSKRKNYEYVSSWGTALQKATTLVRDEKVKHKILRIFKIWEQRGVYNEDFIVDLSGLISAVPSSAARGDEPHEFQSTYVINKIKNCSKLEKDTDYKLKVLKEHNPKIVIDAETCTLLKERAHVDDVEKEIDVYKQHVEDYINALKLEIKNRIALISVLKQAGTNLEADRKDVKLVSHAYKTFGLRVKNLEKKLDEHKSSLCSPVPSPDVNAPSPSPDSDIDLPDGDVSAVTESFPFSNPGYYNPANDSNNSFLSTNGFNTSTFIGSGFNLQNLNSGSLFSSNNSNEASSNNTPLPVAAPTSAANYPYPTSQMPPLLPPPMPPFDPKTTYNPASTTSTYDPTADYSDNFGSMYTSLEVDNFNNQSNVYSAHSDEYNPEQDVELWEPDGSWPQQLPIETPESPPLFEKESYVEPREYHDNVRSGAVDVDHRVLPGISADLGEDSRGSLGGKDVDHRNLISLTGSPADSGSNPASDSWRAPDTDFRSNKPADQDYRLPFDIQLPPPPPPPSKIISMHMDKPLSVKRNDNVDSSIDMDMSDEELQKNHNKMLGHYVMEPPPPLPDLPDDIDANNFLDDLNNDLNEFSNLSDDVPSTYDTTQPPPQINHAPVHLPPPPLHMPIQQHTWPAEYQSETQGGDSYMEQDDDAAPPSSDWNNEANRNHFGGFRGRGCNHLNNNNNRGGFGFNDGGKAPRGRGRGTFNSFRPFRGRGAPRGGFRGNQRQKGVT